MECNIATNDIYVGAMLSTMYVYMPCISCKSRDWYKKKTEQVQGQPVVWGQNIYNIRKECYLFCLKSAWSHFMLFVKYS